MIRSHFTGAVSEQGDFKRQFPKDAIRRVIAYYSLNYHVLDVCWNCLKLILTSTHTLVTCF